jgi:hypothetical protein
MSFTESKNCGNIAITNKCFIGEAACPTWISIDYSQRLNVNTNNRANVGTYSLNIKTTYTYNGVTNAQTFDTPVSLNVLCGASFSTTSTPEGPFTFDLQTQTQAIST